MNVKDCYKILLVITLFFIYKPAYNQSIKRTQSGLPCAGDTKEYVFNSGKDGNCNVISFGASYVKNGQFVNVPSTVVSTNSHLQPIKISVTWPTAAAGGMGYLYAWAISCCIIDVFCEEVEVSLFEPLGTSDFVIDGPDLECSFSGSQSYTIATPAPGASYAWSSNASAGISALPVSGQGSSEAHFGVTPYNGNLPTTAIITVTGSNATCPGISSVTKTKQITRSLSGGIPVSPTITAANYVQNTTKNGLNVMTIQGNQTPALGVTVNYRSDSQIKIVPTTTIKPGVTMKIGITCEFSDIGGRLASGTVETPEIITAVENNFNEENLSFNVFPNPAKTQTTIKYSVKENGFVKLHVADNMGKVLSILIDEENVRKGNYEFIFNTKGLNPGMYFFTLTTSGFKETNRLVVTN